jgi:hypothetical protein
MPFTVSPHRLLVPFVAALALLAGLCASVAAPARASTTQISIMEPGPHLDSDPVDTLHTLRLLGVSEIRLNMGWDDVAPNPTARKPPAHFNGTNPADYPASHWAVFDAIIRDAQAAGIGIDLDLSGKAPQWAMPGYPPVTYQGSQYPSASDYQQYVEAAGKRYSGTYTPPGSTTPLPDVSVWSIWNEPNYVSSLRPQGTGHNDSILTSPRLYRGLVAAAWKGLGATGHGHDKIIFGELAARGYPNLKINPGMWPVTFLQSLYCVDSKYRELRGTAATQQGCPKTAAASRRFRASNPGLFDASGVSVHPYSRWYPPNVEKYFTCVKGGLCASLAQVGNLITAIGKVQRAYGSSRKLPVYSTEYGYQTSPPKLSYDPTSMAHNVSTATAAVYLNQAEYMSYKNPQIASYDQYLLFDPEAPTKANDYGSYASGIETWNGTLKPTYNAFRLPVYLPKTTVSSGGSLEVWGDARPAPFASLDTGGAAQTVAIEFEPRGSSTFTTLVTVPVTNREGYFDVRETFPSTGTVRLAYTYPATDMMLAPGYTVFSRNVSITVS